jgi:SAM-dependent methyltransferase
VINSRVQATGGYYQELRTPMLSLVRGVPKRVLEIGCASGRTLAYFQERGAEFTVGVEYSPDVAAQAEARGVGQIIVGDIERLELDLEPASFDLLIAGHVLEHLTDPWQVLRKLRAFLKPGGQFVGGLPNVRHHSVVLPLVFHGKWEYQPSGVMDWTHLRFFSRGTAQALVRNAGFEVDQIVPEFGRKSEIANTLTLKLFSNFLSYAYNISATNVDSTSSNPKTLHEN